MNASQTLNQPQINAALYACEFFLDANNAGEIFANLRVSREIQTQYPQFVSTLLDLLENFDGASIIWRGKPRHGWFVIQFTSTLKHYLSLAASICNPVGKGRCSPSNIPINRLRTMQLLWKLMVRRDQLAGGLMIPPLTSAQESTKTESETSLPFAVVTSHPETLEALKDIESSGRQLEDSILPILPDPWITPERYPAVVNLERPLCPVPWVGLLPPAKDSETEIEDAARETFGDWQQTETREQRREELQRLTKAQLGKLLGWKKGKIHTTKKAALIEALLDANQRSLAL